MAACFQATARGFVDAAVWFSFQRDSRQGLVFGLGQLVDAPDARDQSGRRGQAPSSHAVSRYAPPQPGAEAVRSFEVSLAAEVDLDLSPQLNPVLRSEIVFNVTLGIKTALRRQVRSSSFPGTFFNSLLFHF